VDLRAVLGIIGGSGLYDLPGLTNPEWKRVESPWGEPSDDVLFAELDGMPCGSCRATAAGTASRPPTSITAPI
jgi:purine nucleoside phosphorylase